MKVSELVVSKSPGVPPGDAAVSSLLQDFQVWAVDYTNKKGKKFSQVKRAGVRGNSAARREDGKK